MKQTICLLGIFTALTVVGGCAHQSQLEVYLIDLAPQPSTALEQRLRVKLRLQNIGDRPFTATGMNVRLDVNGSRLASGVSDESFTVAALGETEAEVTMSIGLFDVIRQVLRMGQQQSVRYTLSGSVHTGGLRPRAFTRSGEFSPDTLIKLQPLAPGPLTVR